jgi:hypothetical protein
MMDERLSPLAATMTTPNDPMLAAYDNYWQGLTGQGEGSGWFGMNTIPQEMARLQGVSDEYGGLSPEYLQAFGDSALMPGPGVMATVGKAGSVADALSGVADDLPMDTASQMARADELFPIDAYHGSPRGDLEEITRFHGGMREGVFNQTGESKGMNSLGTWFSSRGDDMGASMYAGNNGTVYPARLRLENPLVIEGQGKNVLSSTGDDAFQGLYDVIEQYTPGQTASIPMRNVEPVRQALMDQGYDGIVLKNTFGDGDSPQDMYVLFNDANARSRFAKFDPRNINSRDLLASGLGGLLGLGLMNANEAEAGQ